MNMSCGLPAQPLGSTDYDLPFRHTWQYSDLPLYVYVYIFFLSIMSPSPRLQCQIWDLQCDGSSCQQDD